MQQVIDNDRDLWFHRQPAENRAQQVFATGAIRGASVLGRDAQFRRFHPSMVRPEL
jgi:hypothetical protein